MSYEEEQQRKSRVVVETPLERREVVQHQVVRAPERRGFSTGAVAAVALAAIALTSVIFLFMMTSGDDDDTSVSANIRVASQPTPVAQQPVMAPQSPTVQTPPPITTIVVPQPVPMDSAPPATGVPPITTTAPVASANEDAAIEARIKKAFSDDESLKNAGLSVIYVGGKAMLSGSVRSQEAKERAVELTRQVAGVKEVDASLVTVAPSTQ